MKGKFLLAWMLFAICMSIIIHPFFIGDINKNISAGLILGFFAGVLSQIEGNTRK